MAKKATKNKKRDVVRKQIYLADIGAIIASVWFMYTVASNVYDKVTYDVKNAPASYALIAGVAAITYSILTKKRLSFTISFCIGILVASLFIWLLGLSSGLSLLQ